MTVRGIRGFPGEMCGAGVPPGFVGGVAGAAVAEVAARRVRPPEPMCPAVFSGAPRAKVREDAAVRGKPVYLAPGVPPGGTRRIPGPRVESAG
ncbi:MAG: transposase, partial [Betaproteobacteria bacterium]|nr:transposase [Betaproteobacteria bacterium]